MSQNGIGSTEGFIQVERDAEGTPTLGIYYIIIVLIGAILLCYFMHVCWIFNVFAVDLMFYC